MFYNQADIIRVSNILGNTQYLLCFNYRHDVRHPMGLEVEDVRGAVHAPDKEAGLHLVNPGPVPRAGAGKDIQDVR